MLPTWAAALLERLVPFRHHADVIGDIAEIYSWISADEGRLRAYQWYAGQLLRTLPVFVFDGFNLGSSMFRNYVRVAVRNLAKRKFYAGLNIGGLAIGMGICLLILQYVTFETSFDKYHERTDDLYQVNVQVFAGEKTQTYDTYTWHAMAQAIRSSVPEADEVVRMHPVYGSATITLPDDAEAIFETSEFAYVDPAFFNMFDYEVLAGDPVSTLTDPQGIVVSRTDAERLFGTTDVVGRQLKIYSWIDETYSIGAVLENTSGNSHIHETMFAPLQPLIDDENGQYAEDNGWSWSNFITYIMLHPGADVQAATNKVSDTIYASNREEWDSRQQSIVAGLQPVKDLHLFSTFGGQWESAGVYRTVLFVSIIGLFVLVIAWLNFVNLSTSRAMERAMEVGIRKASGARRAQVTTQFLTESLVTNAVALVLAVGVAYYGTPWLNELADTNISTEIWKSVRLWILLFALFGLGSVLASLYPSFLVSRYQPATILSGLKTGGVKGARTRQGMVVFQFALSIALLSGTWIVYKQIQHLKEVDPGFSVDQVLVVERPGIIDDVDQYVSARNAFLEEMRGLSSIDMVTHSTMVPGSGYNMTTLAQPAAAPNDESFVVSAFWIGREFLETYDMTIVAGRALDLDSESDREFGMIINETAMREFGYDDPAEAVGERVTIGDDSPADIVGIVKDFNWMSAKEATSPVLMFSTRGGSYFSMKLVGGSISATLPSIENSFKASFPGNTFDYRFGDERFNELYQDEVRLMNLVSVFALFALLVAALGLVGLAALTASQRYKEISVRKVLGAGHLNVARLMTGQFVSLIAVGTFLAVPAVWFVANSWLNNFGSRMTLTPDLFILPALVVLTVSILATAYHTWRLSTSNPIEGIRAN